MSRIRIDLKRLPIVAQYAIAIAVAAGVMTVAYRVGSRRPTPEWPTDVAIPVWQWVGTIILFALILAAVFRKIARR